MVCGEYTYNMSGLGPSAVSQPSTEHRGGNCGNFGNQVSSLNSIWQTIFKLETFKLNLKQ